MNEVTAVQDDPFKGKYFQWMIGDDIGLSDIVERTILINNKPHILFESGRQISVDEVQKTMMPIDFAEAFVPELQLKYSKKNNNIDNEKQSIKNEIKIIDDPIKILLNKASKKDYSYNLALNIPFIDKKMYDVICENFEITEENLIKSILDEQAREYIINQIISFIKENGFNG